MTYSYLLSSKKYFEYRSLLLLMIILFCVHTPQCGFIDMCSYHSIHDRHGCKHVVVLVVVLMHSIASDKKEVLHPSRMMSM